MQTEPRPTQTPMLPVQPTGFFTGVQVRPVILGVVVDYIATYAAMYLYFFVYLTKELAKQGAASGEDIARYMSTTEGLMTAFVIGTVGTAIGGFVAALKAGRFHAKHGAFVAVGSLTISFLEQLASEAPPPVPEWYRALSVLALIPAGALGGYVAQFLQGAASSPPPGKWPSGVDRR